MNKKYLLILGVTLIIVLALILPACTKPAPAPSPTPAPAPEPTKPIKLKFSYTMPQGMSLAAGWDLWGEEVAKRTDGRVTVENYPGGTLFKLPVTMDSVASGVADVANTSVGAFSQRFVLANVGNYPTLGYPDTTEGTLAADLAYMELCKKYPEAEAEWKGYKLLWYHQLLNYILVSKKKEVKTPQDIKGLKVGGTGSKMTFIDQLGGSSVNLEPPESYISLDKGVTDAYLLTWSQINIYKPWEIAKYFLNVGFGSGALPVIMNIDTWNKISPADQKILLEVGNEVRIKGTENMMKGALAGQKTAAAEGAVITNPTTKELEVWQTAAQPLFGEWVDETKKQGLKSGQDVLDDWIKMLNDYNSKHQ